MKKQTKTTLWAVLLITIMCFTAGCASGDPLRKVSKLAENAEDNITITDIRGEASAVASSYTVAEMQDMLMLLNDCYNNQLGDLEYYENVCEDLPKSDVRTLYGYLADTEVGTEKTEKEEVRSDEDTVSADPENKEATAPRKRSAKNKGGMDMTIVIIAAVGVVVLAVVVIVLLLMRKKSKKPSVPQQTYPQYAQDMPSEQQAYTTAEQTYTPDYGMPSDNTVDFGENGNVADDDYDDE